MNKEAIYNFVKKINSAQNEKEIADFTNQGLIDLTKAKACWIGLANWETNKIEINRLKATDAYKKNPDLVKEVKTIRQTVSDFYNNVEIDELFEYMSFISNENKILKPVIYRNNTLGYIGLVSDDGNFYKNNIDTVYILVEYINSRLEIISLAQEKEKNNRARMEFLASVSHEFKTPLNSIIGFADLMVENLKGTTHEKYINNIQRSALFLMGLIQNVLDFSRSEYKPLELRLEKCKPKKIINDIIWSFDEMRKEKNLTFNYTLSDVTITADPLRFKQLVYNLISNAIKFSKENGVISIVSYINTNKEFIFEIKDSGDGISKKDLCKIFTFFTQVNRSQLKRQQGSGVGLAVCKKIAKAHGGDIFVKSRLHYGSTFWFVIPQEL